MPAVSATAICARSRLKDGNLSNSVTGLHREGPSHSELVELIRETMSQSLGSHDDAMLDHLARSLAGIYLGHSGDAATIPPDENQPNDIKQDLGICIRLSGCVAHIMNILAKNSSASSEQSPPNDRLEEVYQFCREYVCKLEACSTQVGTFWEEAEAIRSQLADCIKPMSSAGGVLACEDPEHKV